MPVWHAKKKCQELEVWLGVWEKDLDWKCKFKVNENIGGVCSFGNRWQHSGSEYTYKVLHQKFNSNFITKSIEVCVQNPWQHFSFSARVGNKIHCRELGLYHYISVIFAPLWPWTCYLNSLSLGFLIYKMAIIDTKFFKEFKAIIS